jgi:hypothetical protein
MSSHDNYGYEQTVPGELKIRSKQYNVDKNDIFYLKTSGEIVDVAKENVSLKVCYDL